MRVLTPLFFCLCVTPQDGLAVTQIKAKLIDISEQGCPMTLSGQVVFTDDASASQPYSLHVNASAKNVSSTGILLFAIRVHIDGIGKVDLTSNNQQDYFFSEALQPGDAEIMDASLPSYGVSKATLAVKERTPTATANLEFIQFADGSVWGDAQSAEDSFKLRRQSMDELGVLERAYAEGGDQAFEHELSKTSMLPPINSLKRACDKNRLDQGYCRNASRRMIDAARRNEIATTQAAHPIISFPTRTSKPI
jgi:hypothetical protein